LRGTGHERHHFSGHTGAPRALHKKISPRGNLAFHVDRYFLFDTPNFFFAFEIFVFGTGTGPGDPQRIDLHCLIVLDCRSTWRLQGREREWNWERELEMWSLNSRVAFFDDFERPAGDG